MSIGTGLTFSFYDETEVNACKMQKGWVRPEADTWYVATPRMKLMPVCGAENGSMTLLFAGLKQRKSYYT